MIRGPRFGPTEGASTVEFAIVAPVLIFAVLSMADIGLAIHQVFRIDQAMRNGVEAALSDPGEAPVKAVLKRTYAPGAAPPDDMWDVDRRCECPGGGGVECGSFTICAGERAAGIFYDITGSRIYEGILIPDRALRRTASVQVR